jgi:hypothetical protein
MKTFTLRMPENLRDKLKKIVKEKGLTLNSLILQILWDWINYLEKERGEKMEQGTIAINDIQNGKKTAYTVKDSSVRGCTTKSAQDVQIGDEVVINNYFVKVVE